MSEYQCALAGELDDDEAEPPCPPGLGKLTAPLDAFVEFMRIDRDLLEVAAARSPDAAAIASTAEVRRWVSVLPESERTGLLVRLMEKGEPHLRAELLRRLHESRGATSRGRAEKPRTAGELLGAAEQRAEERRQKEAERAARERARREREAAEARERYLANLAKREAEAWGKVNALIATKQPSKYDEAVKLLGDLRDLGVRKGRTAVDPDKPWGGGDVVPGLLDAGRRAGLDLLAEPKEQRQPFVDGVQLGWGELPEHASHPPLVHGTKVVDEGVRRPGQAALARAQGRVQGTLAGSPGDRDNANEREALVGDHVGIADHDARPHAPLLVTHRGVEVEEDDRAAIEPHSLASTQPSPGIQRTAVPAFRSTRSEASSAGRLLAHSSNPASASCALSGCGLRNER